MALLVNTIMEGTAIYGSSKLDRKYDHEGGAALIAMESAEALRDIFEAEFYNSNVCMAKSIMEGYTDFDSSPYAATMEGVFADAFAKIKEFFVKLKDKILQFFHSMVRYLQQFFLSNEQWIKKYKKDLEAIDKSTLKDYEVDIYDYEHLDGDPIDLTDTPVEWVMKKVVSNSASADAAVGDYSDVAGGHGSELAGKNDDTQKSEYMDKQYVAFVKDVIFGGHAPSNFSSEDDDLGKACWSYFRKGAEDTSDKEKKEVTSFWSTAISALEKSTKQIAGLNKMITKLDSGFKKAIKFVDDKAKEIDKTADATQDATQKKSYQDSAARVRLLSSLTSRCQTAYNTFANAWKSAVQERNKTYMGALMGAFRYSRKHSS